MFGSITKHFTEQVLDKAIDHLGQDGTAGLSGVGTLSYDYELDKFSIEVNPDMRERVRKAWRWNHPEEK